MTTATRTAITGALLFIPVMILGGLSLLHDYNRSTGTLWTVPIAGYDPRDPLRGHYLRYRYEWNLAAGPQARACRGADCALCTDDPARFDPEVRIVPLAAAPTACASFIAGSTQGGVDPVEGFFIRGSRDNLTRYYIPESEAARLQRLLTANAAETAAFAVGLRVTDDGIAYIEGMYVDGVPLEEWLRAN